MMHSEGGKNTLIVIYFQASEICRWKNNNLEAQHFKNISITLHLDIIFKYRLSIFSTTVVKFLGNNSTQQVGLLSFVHLTKTFGEKLASNL